MLSGHTQHSFTLSGRTQKVVCMWRLCALYSAMCLSLWQPSDASRRRCGSDLLNDLKFVCGDRGIYLGRGSWSGYGSRPRVSKGIVEQCCQSAGCDLHHLEMYCAKSKKPELPTTTTTTTSIPSSTTTTTTTTTSIPSSTTTTTTSIPSSTTTTTSIPSSTTTSSPTSTPTTTPTVALQFEAVFQRKLLEQLGAPNSQRRSHARRKTHSSPRRRKVLSASRKRAARQQHTSKSAIGSQQPKLS